MSNEPIDWSRFEMKIFIVESPADLYAAWATRSGLEAWFLESSELFSAENEPLGYGTPISAGVRYVWKWYTYPDFSEAGEFLEANGSNLVKFRFGEAGIVTVKIEPHENGAIVHLEQSAIPTDEQSRMRYHYGCSTGWTFYLANLKAYCEHGVDLRNKNEAMKGMLNA